MGNIVLPCIWIFEPHELDDLNVVGAVMDEARRGRLRQVEDAAFHDDLGAQVVGVGPSGPLGLFVDHALDRERCAR